MGQHFDSSNGLVCLPLLMSSERYMTHLRTGLNPDTVHQSHTLRKFVKATRNLTEKEIDAILQCFHDKNFVVKELPRNISQWKKVKKCLLHTLKLTAVTVMYNVKGEAVRKYHALMPD